MNFALAANGGVPSASSSYPGNWGANTTNNGDRKGDSTCGSWNDAAPANTFPDWLQIDFSGSKTIDEIDLFTIQDNWEYPSEPTETMTFSLYGLTGFQVQSWNGSSWVTAPGGSVSGNNKVWTKITFSQITTSKIRVLTSAAPDGYSRLAEVEAWGPAPPQMNVALAANGGVASASSAYPGNWGANTTNNGDRQGNSVNGSWNDAAPANTFPDWLQIDFNGLKTIGEIDVFTVQDSWQNPSEPAAAMTFSLYGLTGFDVQYWNGGWTTVPGGSITGNNKVWRKITFSPITTTKIRVLTNASPDGYSRITEVEAWDTPATAAGSSASDFAMARLDPANRTGTGGQDLLSNNLNWDLPLVSLPGRQLDLGLTLSYNSLVWTRSGNYIQFDLDQGSIAPGFRLGFAAIEGPYWNSQANSNFYLLITPAGARVELRQVGTSVVYESKDSKHLQLTDNLNGTMTLRPTDGSQMNFISSGGGWRCSQIKDSNGNFIVVTYKPWGEIDTITDTLGRVLTFNYDPNWNIQSIAQTWNGQTREWATFGWGPVSIGNNFAGLTNWGPNQTTIPVLTQVGLPDGSSYTFGYTDTGQVSTISRAASDTVNHSYTTYEYSSPGNDCPRITTARTWATNWSDQYGVPHEVATSFTHDSDGGCRMTMADGTVYKEFYGSGWQAGLTTETRSYATVADANSNAWKKLTTVQWTQDDPLVAYLTNPRVSQTDISDSDGNHRRATIDYGSYAQWGLPYVVKEYAVDGYGSATELRRQQTDYNLNSVYLTQHIIGLVSAHQLYDPLANQWLAKNTYAYDTGPIDSQATTATNHDQGFNSSFSTRGNVTSISRWDVTDIENANKLLTSAVTYDAAGSLLSSTDAADHTSYVYYEDSFSDAVNRNTFAYPTKVRDAGGFESLAQYNFDFGARTRVQSPLPNVTTNQPGPVQTFAYDNAGRIQQVNSLINGAYTRYVYGPDYLESFSSVNNIADEAYTFQLLNGKGQVFISGSNHPGSAGGYRAQVTYYDDMGRVMKQSNPTEINNSWLPAGDDAAGWQYNIPMLYDWQGRPRKTYNMDGTYKEASYSGCGCAGGQVVTLTDEVNRQQKFYSDVLGRTWKAEVLTWPDASGNRSVYSATTNTLNARDQVTLVRQWAGPENGGGAYQDTTMSYDGYGRLQSKHVPEQNAGTAIGYAYNADDTIQSVTDARGASVTYNYNNRQLVTNISYQPVGSVPDTPDVTFNYDAAGNKTSMNDGSGSTSYAYDQLSRTSSETRSFTGLTGSYIINYGYNLAGELTSLTEPSQFGTSVSYAYDSAGRLSTVIGSGLQVSSLMSSLQYRAGGALKHAAYGDGTELNLSYNSRMLMTRYELNNVSDGTSYATMGSQNQFDADGSVRYTQDLRNGNFDRGYAYDHAGRLQEATSGREARGEFPSNPVDSPYKQTFTYDAWSNMSRAGRLWTEGQSDTSTYTNNRRSDWAYDADGNAIQTSASKTHDYDAASQQVSFYEESFSGPSNNWVFHQNTIDQTYDGNGRPAKRIETRHSEDINNNVTNDVKTVYHLRSSVLGGATISDIDQTGDRETHVYVGGQQLAEFTTGAPITFRHVNPENGNWVNVRSNGFGTRTEFDPLGASVGTFSPPPLYSYNDVVGNDFLYGELGNPFDLGGGCGTLDGMPIPCSEALQSVRNGAAKQVIPVNYRATARVNGRTVFSGYVGTGYVDAGSMLMSEESTRVMFTREQMQQYAGQFGNQSFWAGLVNGSTNFGTAYGSTTYSSDLGTHDISSPYNVNVFGGGQYFVTPQSPVQNGSDCTTIRQILFGNGFIKKTFDDTWDRSVATRQEQGGLLGEQIDDGPSSGNWVVDPFDREGGPSFKLQGKTEWERRQIAANKQSVHYRFSYHTHPFQKDERTPEGVTAGDPNEPSGESGDRWSAGKTGLLGVVISKNQIVVYDADKVLCRFKR